MSKTEILAELPKLSVAERDEIRTRLDELSGAFGADSWRNDSELSPAQKIEIERRLTELETNPSLGVPWSEMRTRLAGNSGP